MNIKSNRSLAIVKLILANIAFGPTQITAGIGASSSSSQPIEQSDIRGTVDASAGPAASYSENQRVFAGKFSTLATSEKIQNGISLGHDEPMPIGALAKINAFLTPEELTTLTKKMLSNLKLFIEEEDEVKMREYLKEATKFFIDLAFKGNPSIGLGLLNFMISVNQSSEEERMKELGIVVPRMIDVLGGFSTANTGYLCLCIRTNFMGMVNAADQILNDLKELVSASRREDLSDLKANPYIRNTPIFNILEHQWPLSEGPETMQCLRENPASKFCCIFKINDLLIKSQMLFIAYFIYSASDAELELLRESITKLSPTISGTQPST